MAAKQTEACSVAVIAQRRRSRSGERKVFFFQHYDLYAVK